MLAFITKDLTSKIKFVAYYQIIGGIIGVIISFWGLLNLQGIGVVLFLGVMALYCYSLYIGKLLLDGKIEEGFRHSMINQAIQTINFSLAGYAFKFIAGVNLTAGIDFTNELRFIYKISLSEFQINLNSQKEIVSVGLNLTAILMIVLINNLSEEFKEEQKKAQTLQEGSVITKTNT